MSLRIETPPPFRAPTLLDAMATDSHDARRLIVAHVRATTDTRAAFWKKASDATLNRRAPISTPQKPKVTRLR